MTDSNNKYLPAQGFVPPIGNLNHLGFRAFAPHPALQAWVQCYWLAQASSLPAEGFQETLYPDGGTTLSVHFVANQLPQLYFESRYQLTHRRFSGSINEIGVRFHPGGAYQLFGARISDIFGGELALTELGLPGVPLLQQQLLQSQDPLQQIRLIEHWLVQQANRQQAQSGVIQHFCSNLNTARADAGVLSDAYCLSRRQIERKFQQQIGLSPAYVRQLHCVKFARRLIAQSPLRSLTDIGLQSGFYDQAHFIRQFRKITHLTPGQYRAKKMSQIYNSAG